MTEKLYTLGRRFERLLYFGIAITAACLFNALLSSAIGERHRLEMKDVLAEFATDIENARETLQSEYEMRARQELPSRSAERRSSAYEDHLRLLVTVAAMHRGDQRDAVYRLLARTVEEHLTVDENLARIKAKANEAIEPVQILGVEIPRNIKISVVGQDLYVRVELLSRALTVVLGPLMMIWLGSLYTTRIREVQLLRTCVDMTESFPHILNQFPLRLDVPWQRLKKFGVRSPRQNLYAMTAIRILIVLVIIGPALWGYVTALFDFFGPNLIESFGNYMGVIAVTAILGCELLALVLAEIVGAWVQIGFDVSIKSLFNANEEEK